MCIDLAILLQVWGYRENTNRRRKAEMQLIVSIREHWSQIAKRDEKHKRHAGHAASRVKA